MIYLLLAVEFFKTGLFAIGGGMATIPFLMEIGRKYPWFTIEELMNMIAISESTPGPVGVNMATYAGFQTAGIPGALTATFALVLPSYIIIMIIAGALDRFRNNLRVENAFLGIRPAVAGLLFSVAFNLLSLICIENEQLQLIPLSIAVGLFLLMQIPKLKKVHPLAWILLGASLGILLKL